MAGVISLHPKPNSTKPNSNRTPFPIKPTINLAKNTSLSGLELAKAAARYADERKAENIIILDLRGLSTIADYFVICSGSSTPHLNSIRKEIADRLKVDYESPAFRRDGDRESLWMVLDFVDVVVHIMEEGKREFYGLEGLWNDAPLIPWQTGDDSQEA